MASVEKDAEAHKDDPDYHSDTEGPAPLRGAKELHLQETFRTDSKPQGTDGIYEVLEEDEYDHLGFGFPKWKKWGILSVIFIVQCSMNFNASMYANAVDQLSKEFSISAQVARVGQMIFLIMYAFGSELWAPWSEEYGRWIVLQLSLFLVNIWQIPCALAPNFATIVVGRGLGGLSSAGGSVTLGMVADMWPQETQQYAVAFVVFSSVGGSVIGPVVGGFQQTYLSWHWNFWLQLIFGVTVQAIHFFCVPETRATIMLDRIAKKRRKNGEMQWRGPNELKQHRLTKKEILTIWYRPFYFFATEPIVLCLSLLSGFSDALIFTFLESYTPVFKQWNFTPITTGLAFCAILIGYVIAWLSFLPWIYHDNRQREKNPNAFPPERRLYWLLFLAPLECIGLFAFAWSSLGPSYGIPWVVPLIFSAFVGIANYAIYMATIDYMVAAYGEYAASATGGNALARDFLAGVAALYATPMYTNISPPRNLEWATTILAFLAIPITIPIYIFYVKGQWFRDRSKFAQGLKETNTSKTERRKSKSIQRESFAA